MAKVKAGIKDISVPDLIMHTSIILNKMNGNPNFASPEPPLPEIQNTLTALKAATIEAMNRDKIKVAARRGIEQILKTQLVALAGYVQSVSVGNTDIILSSGFELVERSPKNGLLPAAQNLRADISNSFQGGISLKWKRGRGCTSGYIIQTTTDSLTNDPLWRPMGFSTRCKFRIVFAASERGKYHSFRVIPVNAAGLGAPSQPVTSIVP